MKKAVVYSRVSSKEQDLTRQIVQLRELAQDESHQVVQFFYDIGSGKNVGAQRPGFSSFLEYARKNQVDTLFIDEISRLGRTAIDVQRNVDLLANQMKVNIYIRQQRMYLLDEHGHYSPISKIVVDVLANIAEAELEQLSARIRSGMKQAQKNGKHIGRPKLSETRKDFLAKYPGVATDLRKGISVRKVAKIHDISQGTVQKVKAYI